MSVTARGLYSEGALARAKLVAASTTFQTWVGAADAAAALASVSIVMTDAGSLTRPRAFIAMKGAESEIDMEGAGPLYWEQLEFGIVFEGHVAATEVPEDGEGEGEGEGEPEDVIANLNDAAITFMNVIGGILEDMKSAGGTDVLDENAEVKVTFPEVRPSLIVGPVHMTEGERKSWGYTDKGWGFAMAFDL